MPVITSVIGFTTATKTRILSILDEPTGVARLLYRVDDGATQSVDLNVVDAAPYGRAVFELEGLPACGTVHYRVDHVLQPRGLHEPDRVLHGTVQSFRLLPTDRPLRLALVSCNDIHNDVYPKAERGRLWRHLRQQVEAGQIDMVVHAGDQVYADEQLHGVAPAATLEGRYRQHYVSTWSDPDVAAALSSVPNVMMWDDHEIYDGWGSNDHDDTVAARLRYQAAETAFREFQGALNPPTYGPSSHGWLFHFNDVGVVAIDGRKHRSWKRDTILGPEQYKELELALSRLPRGLKHLFVVVGTPVVYVKLIVAEKLTRFASSEALDDIRDGWTASRNRNECRRFLMLLQNFAGHSPDTQVTLLGGDIHVGTIASIDTTLGFGPAEARKRPRIYQVTSSGIARPPPRGLMSVALSLVTGGGELELFNRETVGALSAIAGSDQRYCLTRRNYAVISGAEENGEDWDGNGNVRVRFFAEFGTEVRALDQLLPRMHT